MTLIPRFTLGRNLIAISAIAVLIPAAILSTLQYRSLQQLRDKTGLVAQDQVRQGLELLQVRLEERVAAVAVQSLSQIDGSDFAATNLGATGAKFQAIVEKNPVIGHVFVVSECACAGEPYAILSANTGAEWIKCSRFTEPIIADALRAHRGARSLPKEGDFADLLYFQSGLRPVLYAFRYLPGPTDKGSWSNLGIRNPKDSGRWAGLEIQSDALLRDLVPKVLAELKRRGNEAMGQLALAVTEDGRGTAFSTEAGLSGFEVTIHGGPMAPLWTFAGRHLGASIDSLAQEQFRRGLVLSGLVLCLLMLAIALSLHAVAREAKLAELKSGFVSNVSHEMKTPLSLIRVFAETLVLGRVTDPAKLHEYHRVIHNESRRLTQLIENVLDFARMEAGRKKYQFANGDVAQIVSDVLRPFEEHIRSSGFALSVELGESMPAVPVDAEAVSQAVLNLVDNAMKYSPDRKHLSIRVWKSNDDVAIEVADQGIGIPESEHRRIFEKFYRVNTGLVHDTKGSGLGLTLTNHVVEAHGGRIAVDSIPGSGSRFTIFLPISSAGCEPETRQPLAGEPVAQTSHH